MAQPEAWLRGPVEGVGPYLQPAARALQQALADVTAAASPLDPTRLWARPGDVAPVGRGRESGELPASAAELLAERG